MKGIVLGIILLASVNVKSQEKYFSEPIKIPLLITGSFAELRSNHFHSGIDIRTKGKTGLPVYPAANGHVSRIAVSPTGFGHALYIDHSNGTTTVYGHLDRFNKIIAEYVKNIQYKNESFGIDVSLPPGRINVSKNEIIAYSGNSGSSGGPHLHFEIRDQLTQEPLNPLKNDLNIVDKISPKILGLRIYPLNEVSHVNNSNENKTFEVVNYNGKYHIRNNPVIPVHGEIGFGIEIIDYLDGTWSKCGINSLKLKVNGEMHSSFELNRFSFSETRYLNSLIDYEYYINSRKRFYKTWKDPGNKLDFYRFKSQDGSTQFTDNKTHNIELVVNDSYGNESVLEFKIKSINQITASNKKKGFQTFYYNEENKFEATGITLNCPKGAFYTDFEFDYDVVYKNNNLNFYSEIHRVHHPTTPIHDPISLSIKPQNLLPDLDKKSLIVKIDEKNGNINSVGGNFRNGNVISNIRSFGSFAIAVDTIAPSIRPLSIKNKNTLTESSQIRFRIRDELSGIKNYRGTIDNKWVLFKFDLKNNLLFYTFDNDRFEMNKIHQLKLVVTDNKNNSSIYEATFFK
ncbi:MAG: M23 family metallopeptidase [Mariniphaga sp.]|nr:M23 family metallopeptidase [Mariniphaga sp.]